MDEKGKKFKRNNLSVQFRAEQFAEIGKTNKRQYSIVPLISQNGIIQYDNTLGSNEGNVQDTV